MCRGRLLSIAHLFVPRSGRRPDGAYAWLATGQASLPTRGSRCGCPRHRQDPRARRERSRIGASGHVTHKGGCAADDFRLSIAHEAVVVPMARTIGWLPVQPRCRRVGRAAATHVVDTILELGANEAPLTARRIGASGHVAHKGGCAADDCRLSIAHLEAVVARTLGWLQASLPTRGSYPRCRQDPLAALEPVDHARSFGAT